MLWASRKKEKTPYSLEYHNVSQICYIVWTLCFLSIGPTLKSIINGILIPSPSAAFTWSIHLQVDSPLKKTIFEICFSDSMNFLVFHLCTFFYILCTSYLSVQLLHSWLLCHLWDYKIKEDFKVLGIMSPTLHICHILNLLAKPPDMCFIYSMFSILTGCYENQKMLRLKSLSTFLFFLLTVLLVLHPCCPCYPCCTLLSPVVCCVESLSFLCPHSYLPRVLTTWLQ